MPSLDEKQWLTASDVENKISSCSHQAFLILRSRLQEVCSKEIRYYFVDNGEGFGSTSEFRDHIDIRINTVAQNREYTLLHEIGHCIVSRGPDEVCLDPSQRDKSYRRSIAARLASFITHRAVNGLIRTTGFDVTTVCLNRSAEFSSYFLGTSVEESAHSHAIDVHVAIALADLRCGFLSFATGTAADAVREQRPSAFQLSHLLVQVESLQVSGEISRIEASREASRMIGLIEASKYFCSREKFDFEIEQLETL